MGEEGDLGRGRGRNLRQSPGRGQSGEKPLTRNSRQPGTRGAARRGNPGMGRRGRRGGGVSLQGPRDREYRALCGWPAPLPDPLPHGPRDEGEAGQGRIEPRLKKSIGAFAHLPLSFRLPEG